MRSTAWRPLPVLALLTVAWALANDVSIALGEGTAAVRLEDGHSWRPPFGLDRVGRSRVVRVDVPDGPIPEGATLVLFAAGTEVSRHPIAFTAESPRVARILPDDVLVFDEAVLTVAAADGATTELARGEVELPLFEAEAVAEPDEVVNPVDLGTVLVPEGTLLLGPGQTGRVSVRALSRGSDAALTVRAAFDAQADRRVEETLKASAGRTAELTLRLPAGSAERDVLRVTIADQAGRDVWSKTIPVMRVARPPRLPGFGAVRTRLRYDEPISVRDPATGTFSSMPYDAGWRPELDDVVIALPNGSRFVFWRGASYIPFWADRFGNGLCYEWAEMLSRPAGVVDCVEPLMDKELRYGRVEIVESTAARVHVRWTYESTDLIYQVWGDRAVEDYVFYPDGFGTRTVTLEHDPAGEYELAEFILLTPQDRYPLSSVPRETVQVLIPGGEARTVRFPPDGPAPITDLDRPVVYRARSDVREPASAISYCPRLTKPPAVVFAPFFDGGQLVTPAYWGSHWPLARGNATGSTIDDRIHASPTHTSLLSWAGTRPEPVERRTGIGIDSLGKARPITTERWVWLIAMTDAPDGRLWEWAASFGRPPAVRVTGGSLSPEAYSESRRSIRVAAAAAEVELTLTPDGPCVNPVFEIDGEPGRLAGVSIDGTALAAGRYAWDGRVLWLDAISKSETVIGLKFGGAGP